MDETKRTVRHVAGPWLPYLLIEWLEPQLKGTERMLEYGSGTSTKWFGERVAELVSIEHNPSWYKRVSLMKLPSSVNHVLIRDKVAYAKEGGKHGLFDIVYVDGVNRNPCIAIGLAHLKPGGLFILDNSDRNYDTKALDKYDRAEFTGKGRDGHWKATVWLKS